MKKLTDHFHEKEFACKCGACDSIGVLKKSFIAKLELARVEAGVSFHITSGVRCRAYNATKHIGGVASSAHVKGNAGDISTPDSRTKFKVIKALLSVGFKRIGIGSNFVHVDNDQSKDQQVIWVY